MVKEEDVKIIFTQNPEYVAHVRKSLSGVKLNRHKGKRTFVAFRKGDLTSRSNRFTFLKNMLVNKATMFPKNC